MENKLRLAWWNTGLSPRRKKNKRSDGYRSTAIAVVSDLLDAGDVDLLALGEVSPEEAINLRNLLAMPFRLQIDEHDKTGLAVLYKEESLTLISDVVLEDRYTKKVVRRGRQLQFIDRDASFEFCLFLCHWPSRMRGEQSARERKKLAVALAERIGRVRQSQPPLPVIAMGDFNDEPFDESMTDHLLGSRDRRQVRNDGSLLYNPFWRQLGERQHISDEKNGRLSAGSQYFRSDQLTRWLTVDQALVSQEFLGGGTWVLNEAEAGIFQGLSLLSREARITKDFDHLPIGITIERELGR